MAHAMQRLTGQGPVNALCSGAHNMLVGLAVTQLIAVDVQDALQLNCI